ncbi:MAG TPA: response regulator [Burkholderiales bacterium]|nr:response regulator [Burkholderiales bacterium]
MGTTGKRVLLIDDEPDHVATLAMLLIEAGHRVECATNALYAIDVARRFHPQFVFVDIGLQYIDGYQTVRKLKERFKGARIFALTGRSGEEARRKSLEAGFEEHLVKPVDVSVIEELLASPG